MRALGRFTRSMFAQVTALVFVTVVAVLFTFVALAQTPLMYQLFPRGLADNADAIAELVWLVEQVPEEVEPFVLAVYQGGGRVATIRDDFGDARLAPSDRLRRELDNGDSDAIARLKDRDIRFRRIGLRELRRARREDAPDALLGASAFQISIQLEDGRVLEVRMAPPAFFARRAVVFVLFLGSAASVAVALAIALTTITFRPLRRLEREAEILGLPDAPEAHSESGPTEIRRLAAALNRMHRRIGELTRERQQMAGAIAHDIRTGLTRIRLRASEADAVPAEALESDLEMMERLTADMLAYARAEDPSAPRELISLPQFLEAIVADCPSSAMGASIMTDERFVIAGDPIALKRLLHNLVENARRYGGGAATVRARRTEDGYRIFIEDDGPGMLEDELERAFEPFRRGEASRSQETGGSGLGLGIARSIARGHGAEITLSNRQEGGLSACVFFPSRLET